MVTIYCREELLNMGFHEQAQLAYATNIEVLRVIGGWIYTIEDKGTINSVFVPQTLVVEGWLPNLLARNSTTDSEKSLRE